MTNMGRFTKWTQDNNIPVFYIFYNPWTLPFVQHVPLTMYETREGRCDLGTRIIPADKLYNKLHTYHKNYSPNIEEIKEILDTPYTWDSNAYGQRLESFFSDLVQCKTGYIFESEQDPSIDRLFYRKDAMLVAAIAINIEAPIDS